MPEDKVKLDETTNSIPTAPVSTIPPVNADSKPAPVVLAEFLAEKGIELRLTPPMVRSIDGGGVVIEAPQVIADYKKANSITKN